MSKNSAIRKNKILNILVREYIDTATPVASEALLRSYALGVSSATIRNDMANLEEEGYITRPHTSAGCIPLDKGYRHYVESLPGNVELPPGEQANIRNHFIEAADELERLLKMAASLISRLAGNAAVVTYPRASESKFKHLELISLHDFLGLLILVFSETCLKQHLLNFTIPVTQDELSAIANKLNSKYVGLTRSGILAKKLDLTAEEKTVSEVITGIMAIEDAAEVDETYLEGLRLTLNQPEFVNKERVLHIVDLLEARGWLKNMLREKPSETTVKVVIGKESGNDSLKDLSLVLIHYGVPQKLSGTVGVIGPTRMDYQRTISTVVYISQILSYLMAEVCSER